ncbi:MAG: FAD/NAD(P)-binding protein [Candidatus Brevundimonas phytovorans]|nr:FAD/NAD(P)-binding protein [Brevundimonas sp.]WEK59251.1 MAG: FAD/NAD(P)-binding protein [Brevundimonas sp.]
MSGPTVAVVGAGFSGLLTTLNLLRLSPDLSVQLIERRGVFGLGPAYATGNPKHLLNVRLSNMSAFPDRPHHLTDWMAEQPAWFARDDFITRGDYGRYLAHLLDDALRPDRDGQRLSLIRGEVSAIRPDDGRWKIMLDGRSSTFADAVVLAQGNLSPAAPPGLDPDLIGSQRYLSDPWSALDALPADADDILLIGTGLTMVDTAIALRRPGRRFTAASRHGLLPRSHASTPMPSPRRLYLGSPAAVFRQARQAGLKDDWRVVVDDVRHSARDLWAAWSLPERSRFLRHLRALWDNHRHRLAPGVAREVTAMLASEELQVTAARISALTSGESEVEVILHGRGDLQPRAHRFDAVINCSGPSGDIVHSTDPLLKNLLKQGLAAPAALGLGLAVDAKGRLIDGRLATHSRLFAIGPLTRSLFWEATAVPDLREDAVSIARAVVKTLQRNQEYRPPTQPDAPHPNLAEYR